jgi:hypothetical protein
MLGQLPEEKPVFKKKFRWIAELKKDDETLFDRCFVKLGNFDYLKSKAIEETEINYLCSKTWVPGKHDREQITIQWYGLTDEVFDKWRKAAADCNLIQLGLYDGCGTLLEVWTLHEVKAEDAQIQTYFNDPCPHNIEWKVTYNWKVDYENVLELKEEAQSDHPAAESEDNHQSD